MKIIELLNKIANGEEVPKSIKIYQDYYIWYDNEMTGNVGYCKEPLQSDGNSFLTINTLYDLNYEVEIIEDKPFNERVEEIYNRHIDYIYGKEDKKIPKKIDEELFEKASSSYRERIMKDKINEIIDYLEEKEC